MIFHTFGDSHCAIPLRDIKIKGLDIMVHWKFNATMSGLSLNKRLYDFKYFNVKNNEIVSFYLGEIDCRVHLCKKNHFKDYKGLTDYIVNNYFNSIILNKKDFNNIKVIVNSVTPVLEKYADTTFYNGIPEQRKTVVEYMNSKLKEHCILNDFYYLDIYNQCLNEKGFMNMDLCDSTGHITNHKLIIDNICKAII